MKYLVIRAVQLYLNNDKKNSIWHGAKGNDRARLLLNFIGKCGSEDNGRDYNQLIKSYLDKMVTGDLIKRIEDKYVIRKCSKVSVFIPTLDFKSIAKSLNTGADRVYSLRTLVANACNAKMGVVDLPCFFGAPAGITPPNTPITTPHREPLYNNFYNPDIAIPLNILKKVPDKNGKISKSAHEVEQYKSLNGELYFVKRITPEDNREEQENINIAEVIYSHIWRWFLGERASMSLLVLEEENVIGICSKGLSNFQEYACVTSDKKYRYPGLFSIIFYAYILMENDLHTKNIGIMDMVIPGGLPNQKVYGKIDHDYIASKWKSHADGDDFSKTFDSELVKSLLNDDVPQPSKFLGLLDKFRFSPGTINSAPLRFGHSARSAVGAGSKTTINYNKAIAFMAHASSGAAHYEICKTIDDFKIKIHTLNKLLLYMTQVKNDIKYIVKDEKRLNLGMHIAYELFDRIDNVVH